MRVQHANHSAAEYSSSQPGLTATRTRMPRGIAQCYLPPGGGFIPALTAAEAAAASEVLLSCLQRRRPKSRLPCPCPVYESSCWTSKDARETSHNGNVPLPRAVLSLSLTEVRSSAVLTPAETSLQSTTASRRVLAAFSLSVCLSALPSVL